MVNRATESAQPPDPPVLSQPPLESTPAPPTPVGTTTKKKPTHSRKKGRNQYTKDRDNEHEASPARSISRDVPRNADENGTNHAKNPAHEGAGKSKAKGGMSSRVTMSDMKRRVHGILDYISRKQLELVGEPLSDLSSAPSQAGTEDGPATTKVNGDTSEQKATGEVPMTSGAASHVPADPTALFKEMSCVEMMDALTRDLMKWQQEFIQ